MNGIVDRVAEQLRSGSLHSTVSDSFRVQAQHNGAAAALDALLFDDQSPQDIADALGRALNQSVFDPAARRAVTGGEGYVIDEHGVVYLCNPLDKTLHDQIQNDRGDEIHDWGVLPTNCESGGLAEVHTEIVLDDDMSAEARLDRLLLEALNLDSSDIHMRVLGTEARIRMRVDGRLLDVGTMSLSGEFVPVVNRILSRCGENPGSFIGAISGQFQFAHGKRMIPVRVELLPTRVSGQSHPNVTMRLLNTNSGLKSIDRLGYPDTPSNPQLTRIRSMTRRPNGLVLATGPTGSGKTTTLYAMLQKMIKDAPDKAYYSLEDPQEIELNGVDQVQINPAAGLTFANGLRSLLRKDPDKILVGEIRDPETMKLAIEAGLTGHLVLSTLHTNSAAAAIPRLLNMGCNPARLADTLVGVLAQRVVQQVCPDCAIRVSWRDLYTLNHPAIQKLAPELQQRYRDAEHDYSDLEECPTDHDEVLLAGPGCDSCRQQGFRGRCIITETLSLDNTMREMIIDGALRQKMTDYAKEKLQFKDLWAHAIARVKNQDITLDSALDILEQRSQPSLLHSAPTPPAHFPPLSAQGGRGF